MVWMLRWSMIFSENRLPLFGIMLLRLPRLFMRLALLARHGILPP
jgi:hypothetical protein